MQLQVDSIRSDFDSDLKQIKTTADIETIKVKFLGRKGPIQDLMKSLKDVAPSERPAAGKLINDLKDYIEQHVEQIYQETSQKEIADQILKEKIDITLPGRRRFPGRKHVLTQQLEEIIEILGGMGFSVQYGPDIETHYYNFEALNFPPDHPALDMQDTFYIDKHTLLRTHTSNVQTRIMESSKPPLRIIAPGRAFRNETITARSHVFFHQVEILYIDKGVTFASLISTLKEFLNKLFQKDVKTRFRPSYFPFVEPGMEVDVGCLSCDAQGCALCKHSGWLEVLGAGMVHPEVLKFGDIDPDVYTGYAAGMGVERLAMLKHGIKDIRLFSDNDVRFLSQFSAL